MYDMSVELCDDKITQIGIQSIVDFYQTLAKDKRQFSEGEAFFTGIKSPFLNVYFDLRQDRKDSALLVETVNQFFSQQQVPWTWFVMPASKNHDLTRHGLSFLEEAPALYFDLSNPLPDFESDFIRIEEVDGLSDLKEWIQPVNEGFQIKANDEDYRILNAHVMKKDNKKIRHFIAYYKDKIAAAGTLFVSKESVMLHNLATKTKFKKLGLGTALTLRMMKEAKAMTFQHCFLDSSDEAFNLYKRIGFKVYCTTSIYIKS
ncbi:MAG: GNAT family N-acetyltransferase [Gammaproteobacteria bacterium]|nr:GNAT family N-acetyltransferase [Gammaproteobacteria bacterium]